MAEEEATVEVEATEEVSNEPMDLMGAVQMVLKKALAEDGLHRGLREACKAIESRKALLCVMAQDCDQADYTKLIKGLCDEVNVHLVTVPQAVELGEWAGLCKLDAEGNARKVVSCSCVVVTDFGEQSAGLTLLLEHIQKGA